MSTHEDVLAVAVDAHDAGHDDEELSADEPRTPMWLPLVGAVMFLVAIVLFVATRPPPKTGEELAREAEFAARERAAALKALEPPPPEPAPAPMPAMPGAAAGAPRKGG
jgi:hypothetical protein